MEHRSRRMSWRAIWKSPIGYVVLITAGALYATAIWRGTGKPWAYVGGRLAIVAVILGIGGLWRATLRRTQE